MERHKEELGVQIAGAAAAVAIYMPLVGVSPSPKRPHHHLCLLTGDSRLGRSKSATEPYKDAGMSSW
jgi:hypothetical protein